MMGFDVVLILDDNERRRASMSYFLRKLGLHGEILSSLSEFFIPEGRAVAVLVADDSPAFSIEDVFQRLTSRGVWWPIICFSEKTEAASIVRALRVGALNYLIWPFEQETLSSALEHLTVEGALRAKVLNRRADARRRLMSLSPREQEVASKVAEGKSSKEIGQDLGISSRTVEIHRATAIKKIGGTRATDLVTLWFDAVREA
ncbi:MAG: LuxR C-terminal-related transcriptional regulator [Novosphingobium sp.]|nr:LuxR C-terminal-related transcriptional regulator [Novosphingobium sp.]